MKVHVETFGKGPALALLHGWGLHGGIWGDAVERLATLCTVHVIDLPGHGASQQVPMAVDADTLAAIAACIPPASTVLGWSLGGMYAQRLALAHADRVARVVLLSTTPRFVSAWDWPHGVAIAALDSFARNLEADYDKTVTQFLTLQALGSRDARAQIHRLRERLRTKPAPDPVQLAQGLAILQSTDLRPHVHRVAQPCLILAGARDTLAPVGASRWLANTLPNATLHIIDDGAHALFLSHVEPFVERVARFAAAAA